ncbi:hypothetical protein H6G04_29045 [Calothrix membranacea FACHB-236]|nr:hypothetical protein [Calothrix membranacea FACHB-236]
MSPIEIKSIKIINLILAFFILFGCQQSNKTGIKGDKNNNNQVVISDKSNITFNEKSKNIAETLKAPSDVIKKVEPGKSIEFIKQYLGEPHIKQTLSFEIKDYDSEKGNFFKKEEQFTEFFYNLENMNIIVGLQDEEVVYVSFEIKNYNESFNIYTIDAVETKFNLGELSFGTINCGHLSDENPKLSEEPALKGILRGNQSQAYLVGYFDLPHACNSKLYNYYFGTLDFDWGRLESQDNSEFNNTSVYADALIKLNNAKDFKITYVTITRVTPANNSIIEEPPSSRYDPNSAMPFNYPGRMFKD